MECSCFCKSSDFFFSLLIAFLENSWSEAMTRLDSSSLCFMASNCCVNAPFSFSLSALSFFALSLSACNRSLVISNSVRIVAFSFFKDEVSLQEVRHCRISRLFVFCSFSTEYCSSSLSIVESIRFQYDMEYLFPDSSNRHPTAMRKGRALYNKGQNKE